MGVVVQGTSGGRLKEGTKVVAWDWGLQTWQEYIAIPEDHLVRNFFAGQDPASDIDRTYRDARFVTGSAARRTGKKCLSTCQLYNRTFSCMLYCIMRCQMAFGRGGDANFHDQERHISYFTFVP